MTWQKKLAYFIEYLWIYCTDFRALRADDGSVAYFPTCQGTLPWQPNNVAKMYKRRLIPLAFGALVLENELQYYGLAVCINSALMPVYCVKISRNLVQ